MNKNMARDDIIRIASEVATLKAIEIYSKEKQTDRKQYSDRRLRDTKRLMRNYREIKIHAGNAIASLSDVQDEDFAFFSDIISDRNKINVQAIIISRAKSAVMLAHIDAMLTTYQNICLASKKPEDLRRYRVLNGLYLIDKPLTVQEIAGRENIDDRTVYKDFDTACDRMSALLFGIQWLERD